MIRPNTFTDDLDDSCVQALQELCQDPHFRSFVVTLRTVGGPDLATVIIGKVFAKGYQAGFKLGCDMHDERSRS